MLPSVRLSMHQCELRGGMEFADRTQLILSAPYSTLKSSGLCISGSWQISSVSVANRSWKEGAAPARGQLRGRGWPLVTPFGIGSITEVPGCSCERPLFALAAQKQTGSKRPRVVVSQTQSRGSVSWGLTTAQGRCGNKMWYAAGRRDLSH